MDKMTIGLLHPGEMGSMVERRLAPMACACCGHRTGAADRRWRARPRPASKT